MLLKLDIILLQTKFSGFCGPFSAFYLKGLILNYE